MAKAKKRKTKKEKEQAREEAKITEGMTTAEVMALINKTAQRQVICYADEASNPFLLRRPTRILSIDIATGGGFPAGGTSQIAAPTAVGKNSLTNQLISGIQYVYEDAAKVGWCWTEIPYDKPHARINNVIVPSSPTDLNIENLERMKRGIPTLTESEVKDRQWSLGTFVIIGEGSTEERLQAVLDLIYLNQFQLIALDSLAAATSQYRADAPLTEEIQQSASARMLSEFQQKLWNVYANPGADGQMITTSLVVINQVRANRNKRSAFDQDWIVGGPYAMRHGHLVDLWLKPGETIKKGEKKVGKKVKWSVHKGKAGCHEGGEGEIPYYFDTGYDIYFDLVHTAHSQGSIVRSGGKAFMTDVNGEVLIDNLPWGEQGQDLIDAVYSDVDLYDRIYYNGLAVAEVSCLHKL
jgi:hypothetical protein